MSADPASADSVLRWLWETEQEMLYDYDDNWSLPMHTYPHQSGSMCFAIDCSDKFYWATADSELITVAGLDLLKKMWKEFDCENWWKDEDHADFKTIALLWCARMRNMQPMSRYTKGKLQHEFDKLPQNRDGLL